MLSREGKQTDRGAVGAEFIGYNRRRREALLLQEFPHQPNCRPSVPAGLNQEIQDFALTVHGTPEIELPPSNYDDHLVQVPAFGRSWPPTLNPPRIGPTEFQDPSSNCLIRDVETTLGKQVLNVPIAQRETAIEPDGMLDDDRWKAVTTVGYLAHPETLKHRPCRSHAVNVTMPPTELYKSLTWDRGKELADHRRFSLATDIDVYFCDPQSPWQRGSNENTNGLLRQYFPKGTDVSVYSQAHLNKVARQLNERPRKTLGF